MNRRQVKLGTVTIHPHVLDVMNMERLGHELSAYALGLRQKEVHPQRKMILDALSEYADAVSALRVSRHREVWISTSLRETEVFVPPKLRGRCTTCDQLMLSCNAAAARLLTPAQITSAVALHRAGDWGMVNGHTAQSNEQALSEGRETVSIFPFTGGIAATVKSTPGLLWVSVEAAPPDEWWEEA